MKKIKYTVSIVAILAIGVLLGIAGTIFLYERVVMVDYEGGAIREIVRVGPLTLHEVELPMTAFQLIPLQEGASLSADHDWHMAQRFSAWSQVSPSSRGGEVLSVMADLASAVPIIGMDEASKIKTRLIQDLRAKDPYEATETAKERILEAMDDKL